MTIEQRVRALVPLRFQALGLLLLRREFGTEFEDVRDTAGEGNGCDGILVRVDHVEAFQLRTVEDQFGDTQKRKAREAVDLALKTVPVERGLPLTEYMFVLNLDLQPSEAKWFTTQQDKYNEQGCNVTYRTLGWVIGELLDEKNAGIRREFVETETDRQFEIIRAITSGGQATSDALATIIQSIQGLGASDAAKRALETVLERAKFHFEGGLESLASERFQNAVVALAEARELLKRHNDDPLYTEVVYWHAVALLRANEYAAALQGFDDAASLYTRVGRVDEALWAEGNKGHALRGLSRFGEALAIFRQANDEWKRRGDDYNIIVGYLNEAEICIEMGDLHTAGLSFDAAKRRISELGAVKIVELELAEVVMHFFGSFASYYFQREEDEKALASLQAAIEWARRAGNQKHLLGKLISQSITPLAFMGRVDEAIVAAAEGESLLREVGDRHSIGTLYNNLGVAYLVKLQLTKDPACHTAACDYFKKDYEICVKLGDVGGAAKTLATMEEHGCTLPVR